MFPYVLLAFIFAPRMDGGASGALTLHTYMPKGPDRVEFVNYIFAEKDAPEQMKRDMLQNAIWSTGTSGTIEQDDADVWPVIMRNARGGVSKHMTLKYQALHGHERPEGWKGDGLLYPGFTKDDTQWNWWMAYHKLMSEA